MRLHDNDKRLEQKELKDLKDALDDAYGDEEDFKNMLMELLGWSPGKVGIAGNRDTMFLKVIIYAEDHSETRELLAAALIKRRQPNKQLLALANRFKLSPPWDQYLISPSPTPSSTEMSAPSLPVDQLSSEKLLERKIHELDKDLDVVQWRKNLESLEGQICRVEIQRGRENIYGTGFLVGPDIIMTNYHVVKEVINGTLSSHKVKLYFDYKLDEHGNMQNLGNPSELADDWYVDHSENSDLDLERHASIIDVDAHKLDYALLRLKDSPGEAQIKGDPTTIRGWIQLPTEEYGFKIDEALFILHHPDGDPLKLTMNSRSLKEINTNKTRLWYTTSTEHGSSGAPCFTINWQIIAIHQSGDPDYHKDAAYNQGIPLSTIYNFLKKRGKGSLLNKPPPLPPSAPLNDILSTVSVADTPTSKFALPESAMNEQLQALLFSKLGKPALNQILGEHKLIELNDAILKNIANNLSVQEFFLLSQEYLHIAKDKIAEAKKPFDGGGDLRPTHYTRALLALDSITSCLRNVCTLINAANSLPFTSASAHIDITVTVDQMTGDMQDCRQHMEKIKNKPLDIKKRIEIQKNFTHFSEELEKIIQFMM